MTDSPTPETYPEHWEADVILRDGRICHIRPIRPSDRESLANFHESLSAQTVYYRFFAPYPSLTDKDLDRFTQVDYVDRIAFIAEDAGTLIGVGRYDRIDRASAEIAFVISDEHQGRGLGSILLEHLATTARENGISRFEAEVLPTNRRMLSTFEEAGYKPSSSMEEGVVSLHFDINPTETSREVMQAREHRAEARSMEYLLAPRGVVLIGASRREGSIGNLLLRNLRDGGYEGPLYAIHPQAQEIETVPCLPSLEDVPGPIDLAVIALPAADVTDATTACGAARVRGAVIVSSGFGESGPEGRVLQDRLVTHARSSGVRIIGPNALGLINTGPDVRLNASLVAQMPPAGRVGFFAQSGALGASLLSEARRRGLGVSSFVSAGNRVDISANDMLQYWEDDEATGVVLLYLESVGNPRKFTRVARRLAPKKPVVAVRSGRSSQALPLGHTVRRTTLPPQAVDAMFEQAGVMQVDTVSELFDVASLLCMQPLPKGGRVRIVGNSDAVAVLTADACEAKGLSIAGQPRTIAHNATDEDLVDAIREAVTDPNSDAVILVHVPVLHGDDPAVIRSAIAVSMNSSKPILAVSLSLNQEMAVVRADGAEGLPGMGAIPVFREVEPAAKALATTVEYARWLKRPKGETPDLPDVQQDKARRLMESIRERVTQTHGEDAQVPVDDADLQGLLECYGIRLWDSHWVGTENHAVEVADKIGYPVVLKTVHPGLAHRPDLGGVRFNLENPRAVRTAYLSLTATLPPEAQKRLVLQQQAPPGISVVIEKREDALFGPVVSFGLAGDVPRLLDDRSYRIPPLTDRDAHSLISTPKASPLLFGYRNAPRVDTEGLVDVINRVARLAEDIPELTRLELNPVIASANSVAVIGASATCGPAMIRRDAEARRMPD